MPKVTIRFRAVKLGIFTQNTSENTSRNSGCNSNCPNTDKEKRLCMAKIHLRILQTDLPCI